MTNLDGYRFEKDHIRENLNKYTRKAFQMLPDLNNPQILDIGCGTGVPTMELAKISNGFITGLDQDIASLNLFHRKIKKSGLTNRIRLIDGNILQIDLPEESNDIIWAEGSVFILGFRKSLLKWYQLLKPQGFLVIHDEDEDKTEKLSFIPKSGYRLIDQFELSEECWWLDYYFPLEQLIEKSRNRYPDDHELSKQLNADQQEIKKSRAGSMVLSSFFVILQKV